MQFSDFGLGNGLVSLLTQAKGKMKEVNYKKYITIVCANIFRSLTYISIILMLFTLLASFLVNWQDIFQIKTKSNDILSVIFLAFFS
jgi:hypothetical protein